ncbi:STAS domain-containing protein [Nonomuraea pusilla]|uniref:STAS domain-containing protein n=1 Tax=Nonomuraea pusilla TaxID=46177 RepID=UPI0033205FB0
MTGPLRITEFTPGFRITVLTLEGVLDLDSYPLLQVRLAGALALHEPPLVAVEVSRLLSADSYGLSVLVAADQHARTSGGGMSVCGAGDLLLATFRQRGLDGCLTLHPSLADALRDLRPAIGEGG